MKIFIIIIFSSFHSICLCQSEIQNTTSIDPTYEFIKKEFPFIHMADWKQGMKFLVVADKYESNSAELNLSFYKKSSSNSKHPLVKEYDGKIFTIINIEERPQSCPKGKCTRSYIVMDCEGKKFEYEFVGSTEEMKQADSFTSIENLIFLDELEKAKTELIDKSFYFISDLQIASHLKFIPVTIKNVEVGTPILSTPIKISYTVESGKVYSTDVLLSGTNSRIKRSGKFFYFIFSIDNPRDKYKDISDEIWALIQRSEVKIGMTEKEAKLAWGEPEKINTTTSASGQQQQWVYETSKYLYFQEGKLNLIQN